MLKDKEQLSLLKFKGKYLHSNVKLRKLEHKHLCVLDVQCSNSYCWIIIVVITEQLYLGLKLSSSPSLLPPPASNLVSYKLVPHGLFYH